MIAARLHLHTSRLTAQGVERVGYHTLVHPLARHRVGCASFRGTVAVIVLGRAERRSRAVDAHLRGVALLLRLCRRRFLCPGGRGCQPALHECQTHCPQQSLFIEYYRFQCVRFFVSNDIQPRRYDFSFIQPNKYRKTFASPSILCYVHSNKTTCFSYREGIAEAPSPFLPHCFSPFFLHLSF